jgi:hypothetical protein
MHEIGDYYRYYHGLGGVRAPQAQPSRMGRVARPAIASPLQEHRPVADADRVRTPLHYPTILIKKISWSLHRYEKAF